MDDHSQNLSWLLPGARQDRPSVTPDWRPVFETPIEGVQFIPVRTVVTGYGRLTEILRGEWLAGGGVDQVFTSVMGPGMISAWHAHNFTTDRLFVAAGLTRIVLYDHRPASPTLGAVNEYRIGALNPGLLIIPPRVWHGVQAMGEEAALLINAVDKAYDYAGPDHWRAAPDNPDIPYRFTP
jgi:dTDP-4-dehydrorhamnose 3,5-epimerase